MTYAICIVTFFMRHIIFEGSSKSCSGNMSQRYLFFAGYMNDIVIFFNGAYQV